MKSHIYRDTMEQCRTLVRQQLTVWIMASIATSVFAFYICPMDMELQQKKNSEKAARAEIAELVKKIEQLDNKRKFAHEKDPFTMDRLIREEFNLKPVSTPKKED